MNTHLDGQLSDVKRFPRQTTWCQRDAQLGATAPEMFDDRTSYVALLLEDREEVRQVACEEQELALRVGEQHALRAPVVGCRLRQAWRLRKRIPVDAGRLQSRRWRGSWT